MENTKYVGIKYPKTGKSRHKLLMQLAQYMVGGGVYFWGGLGLFAISFDLLHWPWWVSKGIADILGRSANYTIQRYWVFYDSKLKGQSRTVIFRYVLINATDLIFDYAIVAIFIYKDLTPYAGFFISAAFTTIWDYLWYRFWVFKTA